MIHADSRIDVESDTASSPFSDSRSSQHQGRAHREAGPGTSRHAHQRSHSKRPEQTVVGHRELYVYWKTHDLTAALAAASRMQAVLCGRVVGLQAELLHRDGNTDGRFTVMEIYRHPQGIDGPLQSLISNAAGPAVSTLMASPRVVEAFRPCVSGE